MTGQNEWPISKIFIALLLSLFDAFSIFVQGFYTDCTKTKIIVKDDQRTPIGYRTLIELKSVQDAVQTQLVLKAFL